MIPNLKEVELELAQRHLLDFTLQTKSNYKVNWHHKALCKKLDDFVNKKIPRLMITMPPRHGKSELGSRRLPPFILGKVPSAQVIACSYSSSLADKMSRDVQRIMETNAYKEIFPYSQIPRKGNGKHIRTAAEFELVGQEGVYRSAGVGGGITGTGGDYIILDDPIKNAEEANSLTYRDKVWDWYTTTLYTRLESEIEEQGLESEDEGAILVILTRWHEDDIAGRLLKKAKEDPEADQWEVFSLEAIKETDHSYDQRNYGEALWPSKFPLPRLKKIKATAGSKMFESLYQQKPTPGEGAIFLKEYFNFYTTLPQGRPVLKLISADLTFKDTKTSDYVVFSVYAKYGSRTYLIDKVKGRMDFVKTVREFEKIVAKHPDAVIKLVEEKANGAALISVLSKKIPGLVPVVPKESKTARAHAVAPYYEAGNIFYPDESIAPWIGDHISEMSSFPFSTHDDSVDAETQAISRMYVGQADAWTEEITEDYNEVEYEDFNEGLSW